MANAVATDARAFKNGTLTCMARVVGADASAIAQADIASIALTVYTLDPNDPDSQTVVTGHDDTVVVVADTVYDALQTGDDRWTVDTTGYNFLHEVDVSNDVAFGIRDVFYLVHFSLIPVTGQVIDVQYRVKCV